LLNSLLSMKEGGGVNTVEFIDLVFLIIVLQAISEEDRSLLSTSFIVGILQGLSMYFRIFISPNPYSICLLVQPVCPGTE
jgi:hypothetical protein